MQTNHFFSRTYDAHLPKSDVPRRSRISTILLLNDYNIYGTRQCCGINFIVQAFHIREQLANVVHGDDAAETTLLPLHVAVKRSIMCIRGGASNQIVNHHSTHSIWPFVS